ncbi:hypothetical protein GCM10009847_07560 [Leucobacter tardus]
MLTGVLAALLIVAGISAVAHGESAGAETVRGSHAPMVSEITPTPAEPTPAEPTAAEPTAAETIACVIGALCAIVIVAVARHRLLRVPRRAPGLRPRLQDIRPTGPTDPGLARIPILLRLGVLRI